MRVCVPALGGVLALTAWVALLPAQAHAAACCGTGYGLGQRLASSERASASPVIRAELPYGQHDANGGVKATRSLAAQFQAEMSTMLRLTSAFQLGASVPWVGTVRGTLRQPQAGHGLGDARLWARYDLLRLGQPGIPGVALTLGATLPTGRAPWATHNAMGADVTGAGVFEVQPGVVVEKAFGNGFIALAGASAAWRPPTQQGGVTVQLQPRWRLQGSLGRQFPGKTTVAVGLTHEREGLPLVNGVAAKGEPSVRTTVLTTGVWEPCTHGTVFVSAGGEPPLPFLGRHQPASVFASAGLRAVMLSWD